MSAIGRGSRIERRARCRGRWLRRVLKRETAWKPRCWFPRRFVLGPKSVEVIRLAGTGTRLRVGGRGWRGGRNGPRHIGEVEEVQQIGLSCVVGRQVRIAGD